MESGSESSPQGIYIWFTVYNIPAYLFPVYFSPVWKHHCVLCTWGHNKPSRSLLEEGSEEGAKMWLFPELFYFVNLTAQSAKLRTGGQKSWQLPKRASQHSK